MKIKIPAKVVEACDICKRDCSFIPLEKCMVCDADYCHTCEAIICGCIHQPNVCKVCANSDSKRGQRVRAVIEKFTTPLLAVLKKRDTALRRIGRV